MSKKQIELDSISLGDIEMGPPQVLGGVRLVPLLRDDVREDLRLTRRNYEEDIAAVSLSSKMGPFQMQRFITDLDPNSENHIGEFIVRADGRLEYLKSFRLSGAQTRRAYLLSQLANCDWNLEACAKDLNCSKNQLVFRLEKAGFGYFMHQHVLDAARAERRRRG